MGSARLGGGTRDEDGVGEPKKVTAPFGMRLRVGEVTLYDAILPVGERAEAGFDTDLADCTEAVPGVFSVVGDAT